MKRAILWILAFVITVSLAIYQRKTGPTYPVEGELVLAGGTIQYSLVRSHGGPGDQDIVLFDPGNAVDEAVLHYRRYRIDEPWTKVNMVRNGDNLSAFLPHQPPAGKLAYRVVVASGGQAHELTPEPVVIRFKGGVPAGVLIPHVCMMFAAVLLSVRIGLGLLVREDIRRLVSMAVLFLTIGGLILGPVVQKYAFGEFWTGIPFGWDLTDNKTLLAFLAWLPALFITRKGEQRGRLATALAVVVMLAVYLVPHSVWGSEFDHAKGEISTGRQSATVDAPVHSE